MRTCNAAGTSLIKSFESCRLTAYRDGNGILTIGWGHTGPDVYEGLVWTQEQADWQFSLDIISRASTAVNIYVHQPVSDNQFAALCSLCYNIGMGDFHSSTALKCINSGDFAAVPGAIGLWNKVRGQISPGLVRRRAAEVELWLTPDNPQQEGTTT